MLYTVYRTQNIIDGTYYFGVHKTCNPYDGYLGSGTSLRKAILAYGKDKFIKNVCFVFQSREKALEKERELVDTYRSDPLCCNLADGGKGGFEYINRKGLRADNRRNPRMIQAVRLAGHKRRGKPGPHPTIETRLKIKNALKGRIVGKRTPETREKIRAANKGKVLSEATKTKIRAFRLGWRKKT